MTVYIIAPTLADAKAIEERNVVSPDHEVKLIASENKDSLRGLQFNSSDVIVANDTHLNEFSSEEFWDNFRLCLRTTLPAFIDLGA